ncbi:MAG TPA: hypothetical protein VFE82_09835 [Ramlibacter sp.]|jgi:uncharacterized membrane protein YgcG|uniref:hypothetical protein n=1 Tax=Ramlibacter sp. TaxID=1917967 RepID=UPI002D70B5D4|nr:hypothetical protein [Ramlibacter sp.]HZY18773.1 hypothetical protein [Ramlibacter sp.]
MRALDFSSWQALLTTLLGLVLVTLVMVGLRLVVMQTMQRRRERENRQINERLRTLIAAYKTLGGSFTGELAVDPTHLRDLVRAQRLAEEAPGADDADGHEPPGAERRRRIRDAVEAALSDVILLGTADQVRLAVAAANDLVAGRPVETADLVFALRTFIREALDLDPLPGLEIPRQGPARPAGGGTRGGPRGARQEGGPGRATGGAENRGGARGGASGGGGAAAGGGAAGLGAGLVLQPDPDEPAAR